LARDLLAESRIWWGAARYGEAEAKKSPLGARANRSFLNERGDFMGLVGWASWRKVHVARIGAC